jgi:hypothetical protein
MSAIERWWRIQSESFDEWTDSEREADAARSDIGEHYVMGPYVLESQQLQGAVADAEKLAAYARFTFVQQPHGDLPSPDEVQEIIDRYPPRKGS